MDDQGRFICLFQTLDRSLFLLHTQLLREGKEGDAGDHERNQSRISKAVTNIQRGIPAKCPYATDSFDDCQKHVTERDEAVNAVLATKSSPLVETVLVQPGPVQSRSRRRSQKDTSPDPPASHSNQKVPVSSSSHRRRGVDRGDHQSQSHSREDKDTVLACDFVTSDLDRYVEHTRGLKCSGGAHKYRSHINKAIELLKQGGRDAACPYSTTDRGNYKTHVERSARRTVEGADVAGTTFSNGRWFCDYKTSNKAHFLQHTTGLKSARNYDEKYSKKLQAALSDIAAGRSGCCPFSTQQKCRIKGHIESAQKEVTAAAAAEVQHSSATDLPAVEEDDHHSAEDSPAPVDEKDPSQMTREERKIYFAMRAFERIEEDKKKKLERSQSKKKPKRKPEKKAGVKAAGVKSDVSSLATARPAVKSEKISGKTADVVMTEASSDLASTPAAPAPRSTKAHSGPTVSHSGSKRTATPDTVKPRPAGKSKKRKVGKDTATPTSTQTSLVRQSHNAGHFTSTRPASAAMSQHKHKKQSPVQVVPLHHHLTYPCMYARHDIPDNYDVIPDQSALDVGPPDLTRLLTEATNELAFQSKFETPGSRPPRSCLSTGSKASASTPSAQAVKEEPGNRVPQMTPPPPPPPVDERNTRNVAEILQGMWGGTVSSL
eukprot:TRINITY_DN561_c0_g1_i2.p1 TRINITY_DN561_c0_g1~~TRINITY_DN561_c0_g1_i2.p1  ORF type:complete len:659 (-),score=132.98 TRINITY_DN561_c0_g1_i2:182-2158(-)